MIYNKYIINIYIYIYIYIILYVYCTFDVAKIEYYIGMIFLQKLTLGS